MKILFSILFASTATSLAQSTDPPINYDITTLLNNSIARTFKNLDSDMTRELILNMENDNTTEYHRRVDYIFKPFQNEFYFTGVNITILNLQSVRVRHRYTLPDPEVIILFSKLSIEIKACLGATNDTVHVGFVRSMDFDNISIVALKTPINISEEKLLLYIRYEGENYESSDINASWYHPDVLLEARNQLDREIEEMLPTLFLNNLNHNEKFLQSLNKAFCHHPEIEITSQYPDFKNNSEQYHYFIPNITSLQRTLSNITITGLWNFQSHAIHINLTQITTQLIIKNVRGYANLHYGFQNSTIFPLRFEASYISILIHEEMERVSVSAYNYLVSQTNVNSSLTKHQSKWVMEGIELAIASSIMPSIEIHRDRNESLNRQRDHPVAKISTRMSQQFYGNTIQKLYHDWNITMPESITVESTVQLESLNYNISIWSELSGTFSSCYPTSIKCSLYNTLEISFAHSWYDDLFGKIRLSNSTHQFNDFNIVIKDILGRLIIRNNSRKNDDFDADLLTDVEIRLLPPPREHNFTINQLKIIVEKSEQMYTSWSSEMLKILAKPLLSLPLDYCSTPVKIFDDFLPFFADHESAHHVPDNDTRFNGSFFTSKMINTAIEKWTRFPKFRISFYDNGKNLSSVVETSLETTEIQIIVNETSVESEDLKWDIVLPNAVLKNFTNTGEIEVYLLEDYKMTFYDLQNNVLLSSSEYESNWLKEILECIISERLNRVTK